MQIGPHGRVRRAVAMVTALTLSVFPVVAAPGPRAPGLPVTPAEPQAVRRPRRPQGHARAQGGAGARPPRRPGRDGGWPRGYATPSGGKIVIYQPQVASWDDSGTWSRTQRCRYEMKGATKPALGSMKIEADTKVSVSERLVSFSDFRITESNFPTLPKEQMRELVAEIDQAIPDDDRVIGLDRVLASVDRSQIMPEERRGVKADPPTIFYSQTPAILVNLDGEASGARSRRTTSSSPSTRTGTFSSTTPRRSTTCSTSRPGCRRRTSKGPWTPRPASCRRASTSSPRTTTGRT